MNLNEHYRVWLHTYRPNCGFYMSGSEVPETASCAVVARQKSSHAGISERVSLRELHAIGVNQEFIEEIGCLHQLEYLQISGPCTATDLRPLISLQNLRILKISSPHKVADFTPIVKLKSLERLFIENAKLMKDIEWMRPFKDRLQVLGVEGGIDAKQKIPSLSPLEGFSLEALFLTSTRLGDKSLAPLKTMPNLKYLGTALNVPRTEFKELERALPHLECDWFYDSAWVGFRES